MGETAPSAFNTWPTKEKPVMYKFNSVYLELSQDKTVYERSTYSFLEWLGDVGGLADALRIIGLILVRPFAYFVLKMELLSRVYRSSNDATAIFD